MNYLKRSCQAAIVLTFFSAFTFSCSRTGQYSAEVTEIGGEEVAVLKDRKNNVQVSIAVGIGNTMYQYMVNDTNHLYFPTTLEEYKTSPDKYGNPFLYPWINRLEGYYYHFNNVRYSLDTTIESLFMQRDGNNLPKHGYLLKCDAWETTGLGASNEDGANHTAEIVFEDHPDLFKNFPFHHLLKMTHILKDGEVSVVVAVENTGVEDLPLAYGFHTYYTIPPMEACESFVNIPAGSYFELDSLYLPTGNLLEVSDLLSDPGHQLIGKELIDNVFTDLMIREGFTTFTLQKPDQILNIQMSSQYKYATVYSPLGEDILFICIEPMMAPTNGFNLYHKGIWGDLTVVMPGEKHETELKISTRK